MNCPTCSTPIPDAAVISAAASINAKRNAGKGSRPGAKGLVRNPKGRPKTCEHEPFCDRQPSTCWKCNQRIYWQPTRNTFLLVRKKEAK